MELQRSWVLNPHSSLLFLSGIILTTGIDCQKSSKNRTSMACIAFHLKKCVVLFF